MSNCQNYGMQTETIFLNSPQLPSLIAAGRELRIEVELFQESNQVFVFDLTVVVERSRHDPS